MQGMLEYIYPVMIGKRNGSSYDRFNWKCYGTLPDLSVEDVRKKLTEHMSRQALGSPLQFQRTIKATVNGINAHQGGFLEGDYEKSLDDVATKIIALCKATAVISNTHADDKAPVNIQDQLQQLREQLVAKDAEFAAKLAAKEEENRSLREQLLRLFPLPP